jgi:hypothetical protein
MAHRKLFGKHVALASIPRLEDWALVAVSASHGFLMNLGMAHIGWKDLNNMILFLKSFIVCGSICTHNFPWPIAILHLNNFVNNIGQTLS